MSSATPPSRREKWATVAEVAAFIGMTPQGFRQSVLPRLSEADKRSGKPQQVRTAAVIDLLVERRAEQLIGQAADPMAGGDVGTSPNLERWRGYRADMAALELAEKTGRLIDREQARPVLARWAALIRKMGVSLGRQYGPDATHSVNDTLEQCGTAISQILGKSE